jgi:hypothetical protein
MNNSKRSIRLSKTKFLEGLQCHKLLWYEYNRKEDFPGIDPSTQFVFDQGKEVGRLAQKMFPGGILLERDPFPERYCDQSEEALRFRKPVFEAGFIFKKTYAIVDILVPNGSDGWDLIEVKSSTRVKDEHLYDIAFQKYVLGGAGINLHKCFLVHINSDFVKDGEINPEEFFEKEDVTAQAEELRPTIEHGVEEMLEIIRQKDVPKVSIGPHCSAPYECPLEGVCWAFLPQDHVFMLYRGNKLAYELYEDGILSLRDISDRPDLSPNQLIQVNSHKTGTPYVDKKAIKLFLSDLSYPLYFLDFETIAPAIPVYEGTGPYQNMPFQFSLDIVEREGTEPKHYSYLAPGTSDPRPEILKQLKGLLGSEGSIIAYNAVFEKNILEEAAGEFSEFKDWYTQLELRFVDLLIPFRSFSYYHPKQEGSASLKNVLPALTKNGYKGLEIADGQMASQEYYRVTFSQGITKDEKQCIYQALEKYCNLDTQGMIDILGALRKLS